MRDLIFTEWLAWHLIYISADVMHLHEYVSHPLDILSLFGRLSCNYNNKEIYLFTTTAVSNFQTTNWSVKSIYLSNF